MEPLFPNQDDSPDSRVGLLDLAPDGTIHMANAEARAFLGLTAHDGAGKAFVDFLRSDSPLRADMTEMGRGERTGARRQERLTPASTEAKWLDITAAMVAAPDGSPERITLMLTAVAHAENKDALAFYGTAMEAIRRQRIQDINLLSAATVQEERDKARRYQGHLERYKAIFDTLPVGVYRHRPGPESYFEEVNLPMARMFGAESVEELQAHPNAELYRDPAERQRFSEDLLARGEIQCRELALRTLDGRPIWAAITARVRYTADGEPVFDGVVEDITERYEAEQERAQLVEILEATPDYIGMTDPHGQILYENPALRRLRETRGASGAARHFLDVHPEWAARRLTGEALPIAKREGIWQGETAVFDAEGTPIPVSQTLIAHRDEDGTAQHYSTLMRDISATRKAEAFRRQVLDSLAEGVFGIERHGGFTFLNPAACAMLGIANERDALHRKAHAFIHHHRPDGSPYPEKECPIRQVLAEGRSRGVWEDWFWRRDNTGFPVEVFAAPLHDAEGHPEGVMVSFQDISRRKAAEDALAHEHKVGEALRRVLTDLVYETPPPATLFQRVCNILIEETGFRLAWIGELDADGWLPPQAWAGQVPEYLEGMVLSRDGERPEGQGPTGRALRSGEVEVLQSIGEAVGMVGFHERAMGLGLKGVAAVPFRHQGAIVGSLQVYAPEPQFFSDAMLRLLEQAGRAIGFALDAHDRWMERNQLIEILEATPDWVSIATPEGYPTYYNPAGLRMAGVASLDQVRQIPVAQRHPAGPGNGSSARGSRRPGVREYGRERRPSWTPRVPRFRSPRS